VAPPHLRLVHAQPHAPGPGLARTRAASIDARLAEMTLELGRLADELTEDHALFVELGAAVHALGQARQRLRKKATGA
jgi:hypothetical protein